MTPFEQQVKDALARRASDAQPREDSIAEAHVRLQRSGRARGLTITGLMACTIVIAVVGITVAIPRMGNDGSGLANFAAGAEKAGTFKLRGTMTSTGEGAGTARITGEVDLERKQVHMIQEIAWTEDNAPRSEMVPDSFELIVTESAVYMKAAAFFRDLANPSADPSADPDDKEWFKMPAGAMDVLVQSDNPLSILFPTNPTNFFDRVFSASSRFEEVGTAEVDGTATTEYEVTIDIEKLASQISAEGRETYKSIFEDLGKELVMDIWIGEDGLLYRQAYTITSGQDRMELLVEFFDYGEPVDIRIPSEDEVVDQKDWNSGASGSFGSSGESCTTEDGVTVCEKSSSSAEYEPCEPADGGGTSCTFSETGEPIGGPSP